MGGGPQPTLLAATTTAPLLSSRVATIKIPTRPAPVLAIATSRTAPTLILREAPRLVASKEDAVGGGASPLLSGRSTLVMASLELGPNCAQEARALRAAGCAGSGPGDLASVTEHLTRELEEHVAEEERARREGKPIFTP